MAVFSDFVQHFLSLWRKHRLEDWRGLSIPCTLFTAGCVLAAMSWKLGASLIFVLLYILLGATGFLLSYISVFKAKSKREPETLPLFSARHFEVPRYQQEEKPVDTNLKAAKIESILTPNENWTGCNLYSASAKHDLSVRSSQVQTDSGDSSRTIKCAGVCYYPRLAHEEYVTGPTPGGNQSRQKDGDSQSGSWLRLLPIADVFRTNPRTEPSAHFHVPLEVSDDQQETESSQPEANPLVPRWMSSVPHQPIYQNIIPYPDRRRIFSENDLIKLLDYDTPSKELRPVAGQDEIPPPCGQSLSSSEPRRKESMTRLGSFTSPERTYVNAVRTFKPEQKCISPTLGEELFAESPRDFKTESKSLSQASPGDIYVNIPSKMCAFSPSKDPEVQLSPEKNHLDKKSSSKTKSDIQGIKSHRFPLHNENIYVNVSLLCRRTENQPDETSLDRSKTDETSSSEAEVALEPESIYMNLPSPISRSNSPTLENETMLYKIEEVSSEGGYWADTETEVSKFEQSSADKGICQIQTCVGRKDTNKARSSPLDLTLTNIKPGSSSVPNIQSELNKHFGMELVDSVGTLENYEPSSGQVRQYENPVYGESMSTGENKYVEIKNEEDDFTKIGYKYKELDDKGSYMYQKDDSGVQKSNNSRKIESSVHKTILIDPNASSTCPDQLLKNLKIIQTLSEIPKNQGRSKHFSAPTSSEEENSFCLLKSLTGRKASESGDSRFASESSSYSKDSISLSEHYRPFQGSEPGTVKSEDPENIFSPKKQPYSSTMEIMSTTSTDRRSRRHASFNTPLEMPRLKSFLSPELRTSPLILPPLDKGYLSPTMMSSPESPTSPENVDIPVILNQSSIVQTQLQKFSAMSRDSVQFVNRSTSHSSKQSSSTAFKSKPQLQSLVTSLSIASASQSPERDSCLTLPSKLSTRTIEQPCKISTTSATATYNAATHSESTTSPKPSGESSTQMPKHSPVYF